MRALPAAFVYLWLDFLFCRHGAAGHRLSLEDDISFFDPILGIDRPKDKMRIRSLREGDNLRLELRGEHKTQRFYRQDLVSELACVDCLLRFSEREYMITEGSLLGAARDGFFIPWDSDGDVQFDIHNKHGDKDQAGFYELFTRHNIKANKERCPMCGNMAMGHFTPNLVQDGVALHCWQTLDDIMSGNLLEAKGDKHRKLSNKTHSALLNKIGELHDSRLFFSELAEYRDGGGGYVDVEPYFIDKEDKKFHNLQVSVDPEEALPPQRCRIAHFTPLAKENVLLEGADVHSQAGSVQFVELNCPAKPTAFLDQYYGTDKWRQPPYNTFNGQKWILDKSNGSLSLPEYLRKQMNYTGPAFKPVTDKDL